MKNTFSSCSFARLCLMVSIAVSVAACSDSDQTESTLLPPVEADEGVNPGVNPGGDAPNTPTAALTAPPAIEDEPVPESPELNNAVGFEIFREDRPRLPRIVAEQDTAGELEFEAGLPAAIITAPDGFDTTANQAPYFANLQNIDVDAGQEISIRFLPEDADGGLPGMYPEKLPFGATFPDNKDGSKNFNWQPLQADVGIYRLTIVAVDQAEPTYLSAQSVLIRVSMPEDPSSIPNKAPMLEVQRDYTVRVNDPVIIELKGLDLNGTVPTLEIPVLPEGGTFNQHPRFEEIFVLKFTPAVVGDVTFNVVTRDSVDPSLSTTQAVSVSVLDETAFAGADISLKERAAALDKQIGFAAKQGFYHQPDGAIYAEVAAREFNIVTPENSMKMDTINPLPGHYEFAATDNLVRYAKLHDISLHGHPLVWHRQLPEWIENSAIADREQHMLEFIERIMGRYAADIQLWDVVNEPIDPDGSLRDSIWLEAMGEQYLDKALIKAREVAPVATLVINEFDINVASPKFDGLLALVKRLQQRNVPLDGIGFQMHVFSSFSTFDELRSNFDAIAALGLNIYITELDVSISGDQTEEAFLQQSSVYGQIARICVEQPACKAIQMWGFTDQYSFRTAFNPLPFDRAYRAKLAYQALQDALMP